MCMLLRKEILSVHHSRRRGKLAIVLSVINKTMSELSVLFIKTHFLFCALMITMMSVKMIKMIRVMSTVNV